MVKKLSERKQKQYLENLYNLEHHWAENNITDEQFDENIRHLKTEFKINN